MLGDGLPAGLLRSAGRAVRCLLGVEELAGAAASAAECEQRPLRAMAAGITAYVRLCVGAALSLAQRRRCQRATGCVGATRRLGH